MNHFGNNSFVVELKERPLNLWSFIENKFILYGVIWLCIVGMLNVSTVALVNNLISDQCMPLMLSALSSSIESLVSPLIFVLPLGLLVNNGPHSLLLPTCLLRIFIVRRDLPRYTIWNVYKLHQCVVHTMDDKWVILHENYWHRFGETLASPTIAAQTPVCRLYDESPNMHKTVERLLYLDGRGGNISDESGPPTLDKSRGTVLFRLMYGLPFVHDITETCVTRKYGRKGNLLHPPTQSYSFRITSSFMQGFAACTIIVYFNAATATLISRK